MITRRYPRWARFLKGYREKKHRSAREFCLKSNLGISYPQYSRYESGFQLPPFPLVLDLYRALEVPLVPGVLEWTVVQAPEDHPNRAELEGVLEAVASPGFKGFDRPEAAGKKGAPEAPLTRIDETFVLNRSHLPIVGSDPAFRDVIACMMAHLDWVSPATLARDLGLPDEKTKAMLRKLESVGLVESASGKVRLTKANIYFPEDPDFFEVRNLNLKHNVNSILGRISLDDLASKKAVRTLFTAMLTEEEFAAVVEDSVDRLRTRLHQCKDGSSSTRGDRSYSICLVAGERFKVTRVAEQPGSVPEVRPGLRTDARPTVSMSPQKSARKSK